MVACQPSPLLVTQVTKVPKMSEQQKKKKPLPDKLELPLRLRTIPVELADGTNIKQAFLQEMTGEERDDYLDWVKQKFGGRMPSQEGDTSALKSFKDMQAHLVSRTLFEAATEVRIDLAEVRKYPARTLQLLYSTTQQLSALGEEEEEETKNDSQPET